MIHAFFLATLIVLCRSQCSVSADCGEEYEICNSGTGSCIRMGCADGGVVAPGDCSDAHALDPEFSFCNRMYCSRNCSLNSANYCDYVFSSYAPNCVASLGKCKHCRDITCAADQWCNDGGTGLCENIPCATSVDCTIPGFDNCNDFGGTKWCLPNCTTTDTCALVDSSYRCIAASGLCDIPNCVNTPDYCAPDKFCNDTAVFMCAKRLCDINGECTAYAEMPICQSDYCHPSCVITETFCADTFEGMLDWCNADTGECQATSPQPTAAPTTDELTTDEPTQSPGREGSTTEIMGGSESPDGAERRNLLETFVAICLMLLFVKFMHVNIE